MIEYQDLIGDVFIDSEWKENRTGTRCLTTTTRLFKHDMRNGFPLLTTKRMSLRNIATELEFFIQGYTDKTWLKERGCNIWNEWKNPEGDNPNDLGPIYGYQWRRFNKDYSYYLRRWLGKLLFTPAKSDQLATAIHTLKNNPNDRRMVVSAWNPNHLSRMALPPCHFAFVLQHLNGKLSLSWVQRSCDLALGVPYNIASYGLLLSIIANDVGMEPHMLSGTLVDLHIYEDHIKGMRKQLDRTPYPLPKLVLPKGMCTFDWTHRDFELEGYQHHTNIPFKVAV